MMRIPEIQTLQVIRLLGGLAGITILLMVGASVARAGDVCDGCRQECFEARRACHAAAHATRQVCFEACRENDGDCRGECRRAHRVARSVCAEEKLECRLACRDDLDPVCALGCIDARQICREDRRACGEECRLETAAALRACQDLADGGADPADVRACTESAFMAARACARTCSETHPCGEEVRTCLEACVIVEPVGSDR